MTRLTYTQHTVAFPGMKVDPQYDWHVDDVLVNDDESDAAEVKWTFMEFSGDKTGVQLSSFGDGLETLYDARVQHVIATWRLMEEPDTLTPDHLIAMLENAGAVASEYHEQGLRKREKVKA